MLTRSVSALALVLALSATAAAHFVFIVPESADKARVVFSESLEPDENISIFTIASTKLSVRDSGGKISALTWTKVKHAYEVKVPGNGSRVVYGVTDYGVIRRGAVKPYLLRFYPKAIVGAIPKDGGKLGEAAAVEIVPILSAGKVAFEVLARGKPVAKAEVNVILKSGKKKLETDAKGRTEAIEVIGQCAASVSQIEKGTGKIGSRTYGEIRSFATLVFDPKAE